MNPPGANFSCTCASNGFCCPAASPELRKRRSSTIGLIRFLPSLIRLARGRSSRGPRARSEAGSRQSILSLSCQTLAHLHEVERDFDSRLVGQQFGYARFGIPHPLVETRQLGAVVDKT